MKISSIIFIISISLMLISGCSSKNQQLDFKKLIGNAKVEKTLKALNITSNINLLKSSNNQELLNLAIDRNSPEIVQVLLRNGLKYDSSQINEDNPLNRAIKKRNVSIVLMLLNSKSNKKLVTEDIEPLWNMFVGEKDILQLKLNDIIQNSENQSSPLLSSVKSNDIENLKNLLKNGINPDIADVNGKTPLIIAVEQGNLDIARALLNAGSDVNAQDDNGDTALLKAVSKGNLLIIILLLDNNAESAIKNNKNMDAKSIAKQLQNAEIAKLFKDNNNSPKIEGVNLSNKSTKAQTVSAKPLDHKYETKKTINKNENVMNDSALETIKDPEIKQLLAEGNGDINFKDKSGLTPLMLAAGKNDEKSITLLLLNNADSLLTDSDGNNLLMIASHHNYANIIRLLYVLRFDINAKNKYNQTALMIAVLNNNVLVVKELIKLGADINASNNYKQPALIFAAYQNNTEIIEILIKAGAHKEIKDIYGYNAFDWAKYRGNKEAQALLN